MMWLASCASGNMRVVPEGMRQRVEDYQARVNAGM